MRKLQYLSLRMSQVSGKGKHAANDNCNVLNDFLKKNKVLWEMTAINSAQRW